MRTNKTPKRVSPVRRGEDRTEHETPGSADVKGLGETGQCGGMGAQGAERSEGDSEMKTAAALQRPRGSGGETRS